MQRRALAAHQPRLDLAHEADQQRRQRQHQQHLRGLDGEGVDHGHIASTSRRPTSETKTKLRYCRMLRYCRRLSRSATIVDGCADRRVEHVPDHVAELHDEPRRPRIAGRRHLDLSRARGTPACRTRGGSAGRSSTRCIASAGSDRDSRNPRPARAAARSTPSGGCRTRAAAGSEQHEQEDEKPVIGAAALGDGHDREERHVALQRHAARRPSPWPPARAHR